MYEINQTVWYSNLDASGKLSIRGILNMFQDCATMHSQVAGYSTEWLMENKKAWVLTSYQIHLYRMPVMGEKLLVSTAAVNSRGFIGYRLFFMKTESGELLSEGYSEWAFMDLANNSPIRVTKEQMDKYHIDDISYEKWQSRKIVRPKEKEELHQIKVERFLLDTNGHMNNVHYVEMAEEMLDKNDYNHIRIEFKKSALPGDVLHIVKYPSDDGKLFSLDDDNGDPYCVVEFSKRSME